MCSVDGATILRNFRSLPFPRKTQPYEFVAIACYNRPDLPPIRLHAAIRSRP